MYKDNSVQYGINIPYWVVKKKEWLNLIYGLKKKESSDLWGRYHMLASLLFMGSFTYSCIHGCFLDDENCKFDYWHVWFLSNEDIGDKYRYN